MKRSSSFRGKTGVPVPEERGVRPALKWAVAGVALCCVAGLIWHFRGTGPKTPGPAQAGDAGAVAQAPAKPKQSAYKPVVQQAPAGEAGSGVPALPSTASSAVPASSAPPPVPQVAVDPALSALVKGLGQLSGTNVTLTPEAVAAWRTNFMQLVQNGPSAIPALRAFLDQKTDSAFSREAWQTLGYGSVRLAALDALRQIGGPDAMAAMSAVLGTTQDPREIAVLARNLENEWPGQYRQQSLEAARTALMAAGAAQDPNLDIAPLFEVFQHYGDASTISELEGAIGKWKYYATIALANLPDGAGIPSILRLADPATSSGNRVVALEMVAQLAATSPDARQALLSQARANQITPNLWPYLTGPLAGDQYFPVDSAITLYPELRSWSDLKTTRINYGNQNLYMLPGNQTLTADGINQRLALVDELLKATSDPAAQQALQRARTTLTQRSARVAQTPAGPSTGQ